MPRGRFLPYEHNESELIICDDRELRTFEVPPGNEITAVRELEADALPFRPNLIDVEDPEHWEIIAMRFGVVDQLAPGPIPAVIFDPRSCPRLIFSTLVSGLRVELRARNISSEARRLRARLLGCEIIPRPDGPLETKIREIAAANEARAMFSVLIVRCPKCGHESGAMDPGPGKRVQCPKCGAVGELGRPLTDDD